VRDQLRSSEILRATVVVERIRLIDLARDRRHVLHDTAPKLLHQIASV